MYAQQLVRAVTAKAGETLRGAVGDGEETAFAFTLLYDPPCAAALHVISVCVECTLLLISGFKNYQETVTMGEKEPLSSE